MEIQQKQKRHRQRINLIIICLMMLNFNCTKNPYDLNGVTSKIGNDKNLKSFKNYEVFVDKDTLIIKLLDTSGLKNDLLTELRFSYLLFSIRDQTVNFSNISIEATFPKLSNYFYRRKFTNEELNKYFQMIYLNNKPFEDFSNYIVTEMNSYEVTRLDILIDDMNKQFENINYHKFFIDLVFDYSTECKSFDKDSQIAKDILISMSVLLRFSNADIQEKNALNYLLAYCGIPLTSDTTLVPFQLKKIN